MATFALFFGTGVGNPGQQSKEGNLMCEQLTEYFGALAAFVGIMIVVFGFFNLMLFLRIVDNTPTVKHPKSRREVRYYPTFIHKKTTRKVWK